MARISSAGALALALLFLALAICLPSASAHAEVPGWVAAIDWSPLINAIVPGAATIAALLLAWLARKLGSWIDIKKDGETARLEETWRAAISTALATYLQAAVAKGDRTPAATAAAAVLAQLPDAAAGLRATPEQLRRKAEALLTSLPLAASE